MKIVWLCLFLSLSPMVATYAQQKQIDSLEAYLQRRQLADTIRFRIFSDLSSAYNSIDPAKGLAYADRALALADKLKDRQRLGGAYLTKGTALMSADEDSVAMIWLEKSRDIAVSVGDRARWGKALHGIGLLHNRKSDFKTALVYHDSAARVFSSAGLVSMLPKAYNSIGVNYWYLGNYKKALESYLQVLLYGEKGGNKKVVQLAHVNIGLVYKQLKNYPEALRSYKLALEWAQKDDNLASQADIHGNMGVVFDLQEKPVKAIEAYEKQLKIARNIKDKRRENSALTNMAISQIELKQFRQAYEGLNQTKAFYQAEQDLINLSVATSSLGYILLSAPAGDLVVIGIRPSERYKKAIDLLEAALKLKSDIGDASGEVEVLRELATAYKSNRDYEKAIGAMEKAQALGDSLFKDETKSEILRSHLDWEREKDLAVLEAKHQGEIKRQETVRLSIAAGFAILLLAAGISFLFYRRKRDADEKKKKAELEARVTDTELKALKAQMNPHFIFNSLNSISDYINHNKPEEAELYLIRFARLMRLILEGSEKDLISLDDEREALELYMQLEKLRIRGGFDYHFEIDKDIDTETVVLPPLILQPFVENSIWHGISQMEGAGRVIVRFTRQGDMLECVVEDNGKGRIPGETKAEKGSSMGVSITQARIEIFNAKNARQGKLVTEDLQKGTKVTLRLPFIND